MEGVGRNDNIRAVVNCCCKHHYLAPEPDSLRSPPKMSPACFLSFSTSCLMLHILAANNVNNYCISAFVADATLVRCVVIVGCQSILLTLHLSWQ